MLAIIRAQRITITCSSGYEHFGMYGFGINVNIYSSSG